VGRIAIDSVLIDERGRLLVVPDIPLDRDFAFIYRAEKGARWDDAYHAFYTPAPETGTYFDSFRQIAEAAAHEYGELLVVSDRTRFTNVPGSLEAWIREWRPSRRLLERCT